MKTKHLANWSCLLGINFVVVIISGSVALAAGVNDPIIGQRSFRFGLRDITGTFSATDSRYKITGMYAITYDENFGGPYDPNKVRVTEAYEWTATGQFVLNGGATSETLQFYDTANRSQAGSIVSTMICKNGDPWREARGLCEQIVTNGQGTSTFRSDLATTAKGIPYSSALTPTERARLNQQYQTYLASHQQFTPGNAKAQLTNVMSTAPLIVSPQRDELLIHNKSAIRVVPAENFNGTQILVYFTPLDTPAGQLKEIFPWQKPVNLLSQGILIPSEIFTANRQGRWSIRARVDTPKAGDFSAEVPFRFSMQAPAVTTKPKATFELQRR